MNLLPIFSSLTQLMNSPNINSTGSSSGDMETKGERDTQPRRNSKTAPTIPVLCLVLATDGVW